MIGGLTDRECRAMGLMLAAAERPAWVRERFAALDTLTAQGRLHVVRAAGARWQPVLDAAAGLEPLGPVLPGRGRAVAPPDPGTARVRLDVLHGLRDGETPVPLARRLGQPEHAVRRAMDFLARWGAVRREGRRWHVVRERRPW